MSKKTYSLVNGQEVVWEVQTYREDFLQLQAGASFDSSFLGSVEITGKDSFDFLNRLSTLNIKTFPEKALKYGAFLTGKSTLIALGWFERIEEGFRFHTFSDQVQDILQYLDQMHFGEKLSLKDTSLERRLVGLTGAKEKLTPHYKDEAIAPLSWVSLSHSEKVELPPTVGFRVFEFLRRQAKVPRLNDDLSKQQIFLESNFELAISRNKGCYPGQEVVERIFTYGRVNKALELLKVEGNFSALQKKMPLFVSEKEEAVGVLESWDHDPLNEKVVFALALLHRDFFQYSSSFHFKDERITAQIIG